MYRTKYAQGGNVCVITMKVSGLQEIHIGLDQINQECVIYHQASSKFPVKWHHLSILLASLPLLGLSD